MSGARLCSCVLIWVCVCIGFDLQPRLGSERSKSESMASGWGITGNKGRCYDFWMDFSECMSRCREPKDCSLLCEDYLDCLHHSKEGLNEQIEAGEEGSYCLIQTVTLSWFLNFIDGLWSSCGDERIIVFTTNRKEKLDPALLRPGRTDVHINMSYCTPCGFRLLASNYHGITQHEQFEEIDDLIGKVEITPLR
ncbi:putative ATPase, AAA-type, core, P-loop containing nucleoside triphosphate hydrolase [Helianthus annuus]|nr:putative ATPase, AAA-type, core, P-loop containing nucleoside triphosphate hydrolase [Helianthus annuus]